MPYETVIDKIWKYYTNYVNVIILIKRNTYRITFKNIVTMTCQFFIMIFFLNKMRFWFEMKG